MAEKTYTVAVLTQGCKVNQYESEAIAEAFERVGFRVLSGDEVCDAYVINTCTVTGESDRKAGQLIRRVHHLAPGAKILVTGCFSQARPEAAASIPGVDFVCGNRDKLSVVSAAVRLLEEPAQEGAPVPVIGDMESAAFEKMTITKFERTRAYVKIEDGCENHCTYCAIPGARGRVRSKAPEDVLTEVEGLIAGGCREVVLTGIETASYGRDLPGVTLAELLEKVDALPGIGRIRLGSLDPSLFKEDFVATVAGLSHLAPHFHLSVQSGSSAVLAAMKRKYNREMALAGIRRLRAAIPHVQLTADFIVGFPGESEADFADTMSFAKEADFLHMHVFAYSRRAGTVAANLPGQIPVPVKKERSAALIALGEEMHRGILTQALENPLREVLFESFSGGVAVGHTADFLEVTVRSDRPMHAETHTVRLLEASGDRLTGEVLK